MLVWKRLFLLPFDVCVGQKGAKVAADTKTREPRILVQDELKDLAPRARFELATLRLTAVKLI